jgi:hypothetical protein
MAVKLIVTVLVTVVTALPTLAQEQIPAKLKVDAQKIVEMISSNTAKLQAYCEIVKVGEQMDQADPNKDTDKLEGLYKKLDELNEKLGPEYVTFMEELQDIEPDSPDGLEISTTLMTLDKRCK